ncbi:hypothetical protein SEPCBS119000_002887 [Sporothrix epigloea]|uniref:Uncharacterized protein n=1 Tax=Sporothrix epigloea TaxID=1892477 RepID=A0ABP0DMT3_9PEZI
MVSNARNDSLQLDSASAQLTLPKATIETADMGVAHEPKEASIKAFGEIEEELKTKLIHLRHEHDKHEPQSFAAARQLSDAELSDFSADDFVLVRVATTAYGLLLFGKLRIPALARGGGDDTPAYVHFRAFSAGPDQPSLFHSFHTADSEDAQGNKTFHSIFTAKDELVWFNA